MFRDRNNPLDYMGDDELLNKFRMNRDTIFQICEELKDDLERPTKRNFSLPVSMQVTLALRFYATGSFQSVIADSNGVSAMSVSRSVTLVSEALTNRAKTYIKMPTNPIALRNIKQKFYELNRFPNVIGAIDGTFIPIKAPFDDEPLYVTRKGFHAINVQAVCSASNMFLNLVVKWPGSTHDAHILNTSSLPEKMESGQLNNCWMLGDSAYPLKPWLLTPLQQPTDRSERAYNTSHKRTRCVIERTFGIWKSRFRCLDKSGGALCYAPKKCVKIIVATGVLHNVCVINRLPLPDDANHDEGDGFNDDDNVVENLDSPTGRAVRERIIRTHFARN